MFLVSKAVNEPAFLSVLVRGPNYPIQFTRCLYTLNTLVTAS